MEMKPNDKDPQREALREMQPEWGCRAEDSTVT